MLGADTTSTLTNNILLLLSRSLIDASIPSSLAPWFEGKTDHISSNSAPGLVQSEANEGDQMHGWNTTEENVEVVIGSRHEAHRFHGKQLMYYTINRAFIDIPGIIVLYSFPRLLK